MRKLIPTTATRYQKFTVPMAGEIAAFTIRYGALTDAWSFDLEVGGVYVLRGKRITLGTDLLRAYGLGLGSLAAVALSEPERDPGDGDLGSRVLLIHEEPAA